MEGSKLFGVREKAGFKLNWDYQFLEIGAEPVF